MRIKILTPILTAALTLVVLVVPLKASAVSGQTNVNLTNQTRIAHGLAGLTWRGELANSAWMKAQDICSRQYWAHTAPDGTTAWQLMSQSGYNYVAAGENLAKGFLDDVGVVHGWMASPTHKANILNSAYTEIGVGSATCILDQVETIVVVAHYGASVAVRAPRQAMTAQPLQSMPQPTSEQPQAVTEVQNAPVAALDSEKVGAFIWRLSQLTNTPLFIG